MTWNELLSNRLVHRHATSRNELENLRALVVRDLRDAELTGLSHDRQFAIAYNAVFLLTTMVVACAGYRAVHGPHHRTTFEVLPLVMGSAAKPLASYFQTCRRKRNRINYDRASDASETEARELLEQARQFRAQVEGWIAEHHPDFEQ